MKYVNFLFLISEKTKTVLTTICLILLFVIIIFAIFGFIGHLIEKIMYHQGKTVDRYMTNVVISRLCDSPKEFSRIAKLKNKICFFRASIGPLIFAVLCALTYLIYHLIIGGNWDQSIFDAKTGIASLFYIFDFSKAHYVPPFGFDGIEILNYPHFVEGGAITNYFIFVFGLTTILWYLINVQAYVARLYRIKKLKSQIYSKDLSTLDITHFYNLNKVSPYKEGASNEASQNEQKKTD